MIRAAKAIFLFVTVAAWIEAGAVIHYGGKVRFTVAQTVFEIAIGCLGTITTWAYLKKRRTAEAKVEAADDILQFRSSRRAGK